MVRLRCSCRASTLQVGLARAVIYGPYMTVYMVISLQKLPCMRRIYMVLANLNYRCCECVRVVGCARSMCVGVRVFVVRLM
jgi:hypothetical protein